MDTTAALQRFRLQLVSARPMPVAAALEQLLGSDLPDDPRLKYQVVMALLFSAPIEECARGDGPLKRRAGSHQVVAIALQIFLRGRVEFVDTDVAATRNTLLNHLATCDRCFAFFVSEAVIADGNARTGE